MAHSLEERFRAALVKTDVLLPTLPESTQRVLAAFRPDSTAASIAKAVETDGPLSARALKLANSAFYKGAAPARTVTQAVVRVGMSSVHNLVQAEAQKPLYAAHDPRARAYLGKLWQHAIAAAVAAQDVAQKTRAAEPAVAFLGGLLHDVGKTALLPLLPFKEGQEWPPEGELEVVHCTAGQLLLARWNIPGDLRAAVASHHAPASAGPNQKLAATVALANGLCHLVGLAPVPAPGVLAALPGWSKALGLDDADVAQLAEALSARVAQMDAILG